MHEALKLDATALLEAYRAGSLRPDGVARELQAALARLQPQLNAYCFLNPGLEADAAASAERWRTGQPLGVLDGVPLVVKDNLAAAGMPAGWGNAALAQRVATKSEAPVARAVAAGALIVGKGNTPEFAVEGYTDNATFGPTGNPFDPQLTPGGSSGGVVAALAAGLGHLGLGTDGGGSIRRPAAYCGLFGLKPGIGRVPRVGGLPQVLLDFEVAGPIARSARDLALFDTVLSGPDVRDPRTLAAPLFQTWPDTPRVLYVPRLGDAPCDPEILASAAAAATVLADLGFAVSEGRLPLDLEPLNTCWSQIVEIGLARLFEADRDVAAAAAPKYREMAARGGTMLATRLWATLDAVDALRRQAAALFSDWDLILMPSCAAMPWPAAESFPQAIAGEAVGPRGHAVYTGWVNAAGLPALQLPSSPAANGMPIGVQLVGAQGSEPVLLQLAQRYEAVTGGFVWPNAP